MSTSSMKYESSVKSGMPTPSTSHEGKPRELSVRFLLSLRVSSSRQARQ